MPSLPSSLPSSLTARLLDWRCWLCIAAAGVAAIVAYDVGHARGVTAGRALAQAAQDHQAVADLTQIIQSHAALVQQAGTASRALRQASARRETLDRKTTQELRDALTLTAHRRAACVLDADGLRQLQAARDRAADAAASGLSGALPQPANQHDGP